MNTAMYLSQITFGKRSDDRCAGSQRDVAEDYLAALLHNGQILGDYLLAPCNGILVAYAHVARPNALAKRHHSKWGLASLEDVVKTFGRIPLCKVIQDGVPARIASWAGSSSFYLFTHAFDDTSSVCCGDTGRPIPLYLLPISDMTREGLYFWAGTYKDHDRLWFNSGILEIPAYKQMADPISELSATGRELCQEIESATGKKTFYYLHQYYGRRRGEQDRACPMCGRRWRTSIEKSEGTPFCEFEFRCVRCRLVSHCADSCDDERHAVIGEYRKPLPARRAKRRNDRGDPMRLQNERQLNATRDKLKMLKEQYEATRQCPCDSERVRELTLSSLGRLIKQLQEEIIWYECHARVRNSGAAAVTPTTNTGETSAPCTN